MKVSRNFVLSLAALLFGFLLIPRAALAGTANCPVEPKSGVPIASGDTYIGSNCTLHTSGDVDSFVFSGNSGDTWQVILGLNGTDTQDVCLTVYSPTAVVLYSSCTLFGNGFTSRVADVTLTATGTYTIALTEAATNTQNYAVSLERLYPAPPNAQKATLATVYTGDVAWITDSNAFTFAGVANDTFEVSAALPSNPTQDLCMNVYLPDATLVYSSCTLFGNGFTTRVADITPPTDGTDLVVITAAGDDATVPSYTLEVSCLVGANNCLPPLPTCTLTDTATYDAATSTLTMDFTVENTYAVTWSAWLTDQNTVTSLFSVSQPITNPAVAITKTASLAKEGKVGVLSTLTTPTKGIVCSSWVQIATGTP
jgi:hypothetical protein